MPTPWRGVIGAPAHSQGRVIRRLKATTKVLNSGYSKRLGLETFMHWQWTQKEFKNSTGNTVKCQAYVKNFIALIPICTVIFRFFFGNCSLVSYRFVSGPFSVTIIFISKKSGSAIYVGLEEEFEQISY